MNNEEAFVQKYIVKNRRERLLFELGSPKRRYRALSRFCHQAEDLLDPDRIVLAGSNLENEPEFIMFVRNHNEECEVLSPDSLIDGMRAKLKDAVREASMSSDAAVIIGSGFAVVFSEAYMTRKKYLLSE